THFAKGLKLSTVTTNGVNLYRTWQEVKGSDDAWFYTVFQLSGQAIMEQDERQVQIGAGDITLLDASRPCSLYWQESSKQISLLLPRTLLEQYFPHQKPVCAERLDADLPIDRKSTRLNSSHVSISYAVFCLKQKMPVLPPSNVPVNPTPADARLRDTLEPQGVF